MQYLSFCVSFISLRVTFPRSTHFVAFIKISFLLVAEQYSAVWTHHVLFIRSSVDGHLGCPHLLAAVSSATLNVGVSSCSLDH